MIFRRTMTLVLVLIALASLSGCSLLMPSPPVVYSIEPAAAAVGDQILIIGSGFTKTGNSVHFGPGYAYVHRVISPDGRTLRFRLPAYFDTCPPGADACPEVVSQPVLGQSYDVAVINSRGTSNGIYFEVIGEEEIRLREGERNGPFLLEKIYPDRVTGLHFLEYPVAIDKGFPVTLRIGEAVSNGCTVSLTLIGIEKSEAIFRKRVEAPRPCPICLAAGTLIETPGGSVPVEQLAEGMPVWSFSASGERVAVLIARVAQTAVLAGHRVIALKLDDGREVEVSPSHPTADGRVVGELRAGDFYDGARVISAELIAYGQGATYDLLPSGDTGFYWAGGVLLGSTLR